MLKSNKEIFNNQPLKAGGSGASGGLCPRWGCTIYSIAVKTSTGRNVIASAYGGCWNKGKSPTN
jgi:hypothetical protein